MGDPFRVEISVIVTAASHGLTPVATHVSSLQDDEGIGNGRGQTMGHWAGGAKGMILNRLID